MTRPGPAYFGIVTREQSRLKFHQPARPRSARRGEDILQDVFFELVEANRLLMPIEHVTGWLFSRGA
jgi:hypothetical protein